MRFVAGLCLSFTAIASGPLTMADTPARARAPDGEYISWKEHLMDGQQVNGGVPIRGGDGLKMVDGDGHLDIVSMHEDNHHIRLPFGSDDPDRWELVTLADGTRRRPPRTPR